MKQLSMQAESPMRLLFTWWMPLALELSMQMIPIFQSVDLAFDRTHHQMLHAHNMVILSMRMYI